MGSSELSFEALVRRWVVAVAAGAALLAVLGSAWAQAGAPAAGPAPGTWASELDTLARWLEQRGHEARCEERCYVLDRLRLTGNVETGTFDFVLEGAVLADGPIAIPLFGPPSQVRVDQTSEAERPARIGFEGDSYYLFTDSRQFTLRGRLTLEGDLAIAIPGPLNSLEAEIEGGRLVEGPRLSGLQNATIHFERGSGEAPAEEPTVFQLSRAVRVGREIGFVYRLVMRSGSDLGVVRLPLRFGEQVLEVEGSTGWRVEEGALVLPTAGRTAEVTVTGTMAEVGTFEPDSRSSYEWWLFESDPEHRLTVEGSARQFDSSESPIERTETSSRLYMVQRGQQVSVSVERLSSAEVLGAVVRSHDRTVVLTDRGDLVAEDRIEYENNGIDYLMLEPRGRAIYLDTDGRSERIMHKSGPDAREVMVPLRTGTHTARLQSLADAGVALLGGRLTLPGPTYPLTASRATVTIGLPDGVHPLLVTGGDRLRWFVGVGDLVAVLFGLVAGFLAFRRRKGWLLAGVALSGLWFLSGPLFVLLLVAMGLGGLVWLLSRFLRGGKLIGAIVGLVVVSGLLALILSAALVVGRSAAPDYEAPIAVASAPAARDEWGNQDQGLEEGRARRPAGLVSDTSVNGRLGNYAGQVAAGGVLEGVTPVALPMPAAARTVRVSRELVTEARPFAPSVYYVTSWALLPLVGAWAICLLGVVWVNRRGLAALRAAISERLARGPAAAPAVPPSAAAPEGPGYPAPTAETPTDSADA